MNLLALIWILAGGGITPKTVTVVWQSVFSKQEARNISAGVYRYNNFVYQNSPEFFPLFERCLIFFDKDSNFFYALCTEIMEVCIFDRNYFPFSKDSREKFPHGKPNFVQRILVFQIFLRCLHIFLAPDRKTDDFSGHNTTNTAAEHNNSLIRWKLRLSSGNLI